jgi:hypothetical protein
MIEQRLVNEQSKQERAVQRLAKTSRWQQL